MTKFQAFKLRMALLRIWFMKNLSVFFELAFFIIVILILTGQITETTPVLGEIFGELSVSIKSTLAGDSITGEFWVNLLTTGATLLVSTGLLSTNLKRIAISDIKSKNLKRALVQAGMYFNQDGKLVKRIEETSKIDLNGDGKIGDTGISIDDLPRERFLPGIKRAGEELGTILTMKIETVDDVKKAEEKAELTETKEAIKILDQQVKNDAEVMVAIKTIEAVDATVQDPSIAKRLATGVFNAAKTGAVATGHFFAGIGKGIAGGFVWVWNKVTGIFKKKEKQPKIKQEAKKVEVEVKVEQPKPVVPAPQPIPTTVNMAALSPEQQRLQRLRQKAELRKRQ